MNTVSTADPASKTLTLATATFTITVDVAAVTPGAWETLFKFARPCTLAVGNVMINFDKSNVYITLSGSRKVRQRTIVIPPDSRGILVGLVTPLLV